MTEIKFWEAMKAESEGKTVQFRWDEYWHDYDKSCGISKECHSYKWRIKPEPVKYSVYMWLDRQPEIDNSCHHLDNYLFGKNVTYSKVKSNECIHKVKLTVESCEE